MSGIAFNELEQLRGGGPGPVVDIACPICGPDRRAPVNRRRRVLRTWMSSDRFITYTCARCGAKGYARAEGSQGLLRGRDNAALAASRDNREKLRQRQREKACWLWRMSKPAAGTVVEVYLRSRGIELPPPATVRFLPPHKPGHKPSMLVAYGMPDEPEPGVLGAIAEHQIFALHLTSLNVDGSGKADVQDGQSAKITIASPGGMPLVLAPMNDLMGLAITEGVEDALTVNQATGLGAWAAGSAPFMPKLVASVADAAPDCVTIFVDDDDYGRRNAQALAAGLSKLDMKVLLREATG